MLENDAIIIGGGPAGLTAGLYLCRARRQTILIGREMFSANIVNHEWVENYPGFSEGVVGAQLISEMVTQAVNAGLELEETEVTGIELSDDYRTVHCANGASYSARVVIIASGCAHGKLGVPGEDRFYGNGVFNCALCDGGRFANRMVAVCGGGDSGIQEALYMTKLASKVIVIEMMPALTASAILQERAQDKSKIEFRLGTRVESIVGEDKLEGIELVDAQGAKETLNVDGVLVQIGIIPNTENLKGVIPLDDQGRIIVNQKMETEVPCVFAAGDIRSGSPNQIVTAAGDGATAGIFANKLLQTMGQ
jgi:thioredoxin reductase (NADPH)